MIDYQNEKKNANAYNITRFVVMVVTMYTLYFRQKTNNLEKVTLTN